MVVVSAFLSRAMTEFQCTLAGEKDEISWRALRKQYPGVEVMAANTAMQPCRLLSFPG